MRRRTKVFSLSTGALLWGERGAAPRDGDMVLAPVDRAWTMPCFRQRGRAVCLEAAKKDCPPHDPTAAWKSAAVVRAVTVSIPEMALLTLHAFRRAIVQTQLVHLRSKMGLAIAATIAGMFVVLTSTGPLRLQLWLPMALLPALMV